MDNQARGATASEARLVYGRDGGPGISRRRKGRRTVFINQAGREIRDPRTLARIRSLAIPPAWTQVWISPRANQHLQATGRDAKGRKQYKYHPQWRASRDQAKFDKLLAFARALPKIRRQVARDLKHPGLDRERVLAVVVRLLETSLIRVGNEEYAQTNHSFGLTTLRDRHASIQGTQIHFHFRGKSGISRDLDVRSKALARIVKRCQELPGQELFQYRDPHGRVRDIRSDDVNDYLRRAAKQDVSAKDFRTWAGTWLAVQALQEFEEFHSTTAAKRNVRRAIERVASRLGNTPTVCRRCYVHPEIISAYLDRTQFQALAKRVTADLRSGLNSLLPAEAVVLTLLQERMKRPAPRAKTRRTRSKHSAPMP